MRKNLLKRAVVSLRTVLAIGAAIQLAMLPVVFGQAPANQPTEMKPVVVTGSYIPTAETVGVAPVDTVAVEQIQRAGSQDVLETLKKLSASFGGNGNAGQTVNNGGGGEAYVAIRNLPTLVLINGRRVANSAFSNGAVVDVNMIPLAMIERIEVLKDGSSALYGSEAIGGVVNIIMKKNFTGAEVGGRYGFATGKGNVTEQKAYVIGGTSTDKTSFTAGAQYYKMDPLLSKDRDVSSAGISELLSKGLLPPSYVSPSFPGRVQSGGTSYILAGSPFAVGAAGYNALITKPPSPANPTVGGIPWVPGAYSSVASYLAAHPGVYIPIADTPAGQQLIDAGVGGEGNAWCLLNTPLLGTHSIQSQDRRNAFANASHEIFGKQMELFGDFLFGQTMSQGKMAPSPVSSLGLYKIFIPADSPVNPFQGTPLGDPAAGGLSSPRVRTRFIDSGNRIFDYENELYRFVGGLKGTFDNGYTYEAAYNYNRNDQNAFTHNAINGVALDQATKLNVDPVLAAQGLSQLVYNGRAVPLYDPFALPGASSPDTINAMRTTLFQNGVSELWGVDGNVTGMPFDLPAGKLAFAVGGGFYSESLSVDIDGLTKLGKVPGLNPQLPTSGRRDAWAGFAEVRIPLFSEQKNIPIFRSLEITAAGRYETFDPGGDSAVPKVGVRWQPFDNQLTLRGSYSQSFVAPTVYQLFGGAATSFDYADFGDGQVQVADSWVSNPNLKPADAENYGFGFVFSPKFVQGLTVSVDYYHIKTKNDVYRVGIQAIANDLNAFGSASQFAPTFFFDDGTQLTSTDPNQINNGNWGTVDRPYRNGSSQITDGLDISANYEYPTDRYGRFTFFGAANVLFDYKYKDPEIGGYYQYGDQFTDSGPAAGSQGLLPQFQLNLGVSWEIQDFTATISSRYIPSVKDLGSMHPSNGPDYTVPGSNGYTLSGNAWEVPDYYTVDLQLAYEIGKTKAEKKWYDGTRLVVGCNNITDSLAPFISSSTEDNTAKETYDILGRFVYFEVSKKF